MFQDEQRIKFRAFNEWLTTQQGLHVAHAFYQELAPRHDILHGQILLQLGGCRDAFLFSRLRFQYHWLAAPVVSHATSLVTSLTHLPFDRNSVDCIIAPLTINAFTKDNRLLDDIDRVLKPMGRVVFFGINPWSLWGCWLRMSHHSCFGSVLSWPRSVLSIQRAMISRGYIQHSLSTFYYIPPTNSGLLLDKLTILNQVGKMISPIPAGFYCLIVQKFEGSMINPAPLITKAYIRPVVA